MTRALIGWQPRALSENRARVDNVKLALEFFASEFWQIWPNLSIPCHSDKSNVKEQ